MYYTSVKFLLFIIIVFVAYFIIPKRFRWTVLLAASIFFYAGLGWKVFGFLFFSSLSTYLGGLGLGKINQKIDFVKTDQGPNLKERISHLTSLKKYLQFVVVLINLGILAFFKYLNFVIINLNRVFSLFSFQLSFATRTLLVPLGLSFYTFQVVGYIIDVSRGTVKAERNPLKYFLFVSFFPQIIQGPIGRYGDLAHQLYEGHSFEWNRVYDGLILIMWGFFKKMVIADRAALFANTVFGNTQAYAGVETFLGLFIYGIQLYADFSGGIDISRGIAQVMGIDMAQNFNHPFFAQSVQEYWNRWHMSLSAWMRDYVFYSVPSVKFISKTSKKTQKWFGKRIGKKVPSALVTLFCFLLIGIWHDASWNYVAFGFVNGSIIGSSTILKPYHKKWFSVLHIDPGSSAWQLFRMVRTFLICMVLRVSHSGALSTSISMVRSLFSELRLWVLFDGSLTTAFGLTETDFHILFFGCVIFFVVSLVSERGLDVRDWIRRQGFVVRLIVPMFLIFMTMMFAVLDNNLVGGFLYAQF